MNTPHVARRVTREMDFQLLRGEVSADIELPAGGDPVELGLADGLSLFTSGEDLADQVIQNQSRSSGARGLQLRTTLPEHPGKVDFAINVLRVLDLDVESWLGIKAVGELAADAVARVVARRSDDRIVDARPGGLGLYRCDNTSPYGGGLITTPPASERPILVMVHGFFSNAQGAFGDLWQPSGRSLLEALCRTHGEAMYCHDHATLGTGPVANALALAHALPQGARLHLLAHSRGGLVGELLSRSHPLSAPERSRLESRQPELLKQLDDLWKLVSGKDIRVERFVRVASPMRGTWLVSNRLDRWLSVLYNVARQAIAPGPRFLADHVFDVLAAVIKRRLKREHFPGIEAMSPTSPLLAVLNDAPPTLDQRLAVIAGDCTGGGVLQRLKLLVTDGFFGEPHDLVVPTASMLGGAPRAKGVRYFFHQAAATSHFAYFANPETLHCVETALLGEDRALEGWMTLTQMGPRPKLITNRGVRPDAPLTVVLGGIMGSVLSRNSGDRLWIDLGDIACGNFDALALDAETQDHPYPNPGTKDIYPDGLLNYAPFNFYGALTDALERRGDFVEVFGYDWRKPVQLAADVLAARLRKLWPETSSRPLRFIAHSMGGLVVRLLLEDPALRERFVRSRRNRIVMLGTPNRGSHAVLRTLCGDNPLISKLDVVAPQNRRRLLEICATFPGFLAMMPTFSGDDWLTDAPWDRLAQAGKLAADAARPAVYARVRARADQQRLAIALEQFPTSHTAYVAGFVDPRAPNATLVGVDANGNYLRGPGDGTVAYESGRLAGVPTYYANVPHGGLPRHKTSFAAYFELLDRGETSLLPLDSHGYHDERGGVVLGETTILEALPYRPSRAQVIDALLGGSAQSSLEAAVTEFTKIKLRVVNGGVRFARHPAVVGHFFGDMMSGAEGELDVLFGGQFRRAQRLGTYPGAVCTHEVFRREPIPDDWRSPYAIVIGLGRHWGLSAGELRNSVRIGLLGWFATAGAAAPEPPAFSMVLLGSSSSGLGTAESLRAILQGVLLAQEALSDCGATVIKECAPRITEIELLELYEDRALELYMEAPRLLGLDEFEPFFDLERALEPRPDALQRVREGTRSRPLVQRLDVRERDGQLQFTLPGIQAAMPMLQRSLDREEIDCYARQAAESADTDRVLGRVLFNQLLPRDLKRYALEQYNLLLTLDETAAALPWELADAGGPLPLAVQSGMVRQLRSVRVSNRERVARNTALVVGPPTVPDMVLLQGALEEAAAVKRVLHALEFDVIYLKQPTALELRDELSRRPYRILHLTGHGVVDHVDGATRPRTGMVIGSTGPVVNGTRGSTAGRLLLLTPEDVRECVDQVPELVFINCCHLGSPGAAALFAPRLAEAFATTFMDMGCRAVVAAGWAIRDDAAQHFAEAFYRALAKGDLFIEAVRAARAFAYKRTGSQSTTWGAYQCYGDPYYGALLNAAGSPTPCFCTPREIECWIKQQVAAAMGAAPEIAAAVRRRIADTLTSPENVAQWHGDETVFGNALEALVEVGAYEEARRQIARRRAYRRSVPPKARLAVTRASLQLLVQALAAGEAIDKQLIEDVKQDLNWLKASAKENEGDPQGWATYAALLPAWALLQPDPMRHTTLSELASASMAAWVAAIAPHSDDPLQDDVRALDSGDAATVLEGLAVAHGICLGMDVEQARGHNPLTILEQVRKRCEEIIDDDPGARSAWDTTARARLAMALLVCPPGNSETEALDYAKAAGRAVRLARVARETTATPAQSDLLNLQVRFWEMVLKPLTRPFKPRHWTRVRDALVAEHLIEAPEGATAASQMKTKAAPEIRPVLPPSTRLNRIRLPIDTRKNNMLRRKRIHRGCSFPHEPTR
ncbi:MAG: CHAT domain-containing protein [Pseudomonadota bacterium]|nr:CHAT domain-containing protein [Pseudomonadota bacterium]